MGGYSTRKKIFFLIHAALIASFLLCAFSPVPDLHSGFESASTAATPSPTSTPVSVTSVVSDQVLTDLQTQRLITAAQKYLAPTEASAIKMAQSIKYLGVNGFPSTMCGPLAMAILRDAGLVDAGINLRDFFYLNPRPGVNDTIMADTFPEELYQKIEISQPIDEVNYAKAPLMAGDFVYLFAGVRGNFDHIITVDRVDSLGRAYAVTNLNTPKGYIIKEVMLYDPSKPGEGQFYEWTDQKNYHLGLTGFAGMWIWRFREKQVDPDASTQQFRQAVDAEKKSAGGEWYIYIKELGKDPLYSALAYETIHPASTIKLADAILFFKALEKKKISNVSSYISTYGTSSRTFEQLLRAMLVDSEENATTALENWTAQTLDPNQTLHDLGFKNTFITPRQSTAEEMVRMFEAFYQGNLVTAESRQIILKYLAEITPNDSTLIGVIRKNLGPNDILYDKRGEISSGRVIVSDLALLCKGDKTYLIAIYAYHDTRNSSGTYQGLQNSLENISLLFWNYISGPDN